MTPFRLRQIVAIFVLLASARVFAVSPEKAAFDSPRTAVSEFLELCRDGNYADAAQYLDLSDLDPARGPELAQHLFTVIDRHVALDLSQISALSGGNPADGLPPGTEEIGRVSGLRGARGPLRMEARANTVPHWRFTERTVKHIDDWYQHLPQRWLVDRIPAALQQNGPLDLAYWQWMVLTAVLVVGWGVGYLLGRATRFLLGTIVARTKNEWDDRLLARLGGPLTFLWTLASIYLFAIWFGLSRAAQTMIDRGVKVGVYFTLFWMLLRSVDVARQMIHGSRWARHHAAGRSLVPLASRVVKVFVVVMGIVAMLSELGYPVASLLAGLGIGGVAIALASQKTVENLFGAFALGADQPFREGDFVGVDNIVGTVEEIGLRSTRIRTLDRTLVSLPNGKLADMRLESYAVRDRMRLASTIALTYDTTVAQIREVLRGLEAALRAQPKIWKESLSVKLEKFGASSLDIAVSAWFETSDSGEFESIRQEVLLQFMEVIDHAGARFAMPGGPVIMMSGANESPDATKVQRESTQPQPPPAQKPSNGNTRSS